MNLNAKEERGGFREREGGRGLGGSKALKGDIGWEVGGGGVAFWILEESWVFEKIKNPFEKIKGIFFKVTRKYLKVSLSSFNRAALLKEFA